MVLESFAMSTAFVEVACGGASIAEVVGVSPIAYTDLMKLVLNIVGVLAVLLGVIGLFLPLLPTTPFLLLAAACFARGSTRMHNWLLNHRMFGSLLRNYEEGRGIPARAKVMALAMMWASLAFAMWRFDNLWLRLALLVTGVGVSIYLVRLPVCVDGGTAPRPRTMGDPLDKG